MQFMKIFILVFLLSSCRTGQVPFMPVTSNDQGYSIASEADAEFYQNIAKVLDFYGEKYSKRGGIIMYDKVAFESNLELMMNYTSKARDDAWLLEHTDLSSTTK